MISADSAPGRPSPLSLLCLPDVSPAAGVYRRDAGRGRSHSINPQRPGPATRRPGAVLFCCRSALSWPLLLRLLCFVSLYCSVSFCLALYRPVSSLSSYHRTVLAFFVAAGCYFAILPSIIPSSEVSRHFAILNRVSASWFFLSCRSVMLLLCTVLQVSCPAI